MYARKPVPCSEAQLGIPDASPRLELITSGHLPCAVIARSSGRKDTSKPRGGEPFAFRHMGQKTEVGAGVEVGVRFGVGVALSNQKVPPVLKW